MKLAKTISIYVAASLILQSILLLFLNNYYFSDEESIKYKSVKAITSKITTTPVPTLTINKGIEIKVPSDVTEIQTSYDGKYITYYTNNTLSLVNTTTADKSEILLDSKSIKSLHRWLNDRNIMIIAEKQIDKGKNIIKFYSYDVKNNIKKETKDYMNNREVYIDLPNSDADIIDIAFNVNNTITYPKISVNSKTSTIYRVDVSLPIEKLALKTSYLGKIKVSNLYDKVIYEDTLNKKIYFGTDQKPLSINGVSTYSLIDVDKDSNIYVGELVNDKITAIFYGGLKDSTENWQKYTLEEPVNQDSVFASLDGRVFVNDSLNRTIKDLFSQKATKYDGIFVNINEKTVISLKNGESIIQTDLNK